MNEVRKKLVIRGNAKELTEEIRTALKLNEGDEVELFCAANKQVIIQKTKPVCFVCGAIEDLHNMGSNIILCKDCIKSICSAILEKAPEEKFKEIEKNLQ